MRIDGAWEPCPLDELFPYRWESGPRYARSNFRSSRQSLSQLGAAACGRLAKRGIHAERIRFRNVRWKKTLGSAEQPRVGLRIEEPLEWTCGRRARQPAGRPF
jgi:hypothetical protein